MEKLNYVSWDSILMNLNKVCTRYNKNSYIYIVGEGSANQEEILIIVLFVYNVTGANQDTRALTRVRYIFECAWWKKKKGRTPSAKHLLRPPLLNDFTHCASKYQPLVFRGSLCRDNLNIKATMVNVTGIYIIIHQNSISIYPRMYRISRPIVSRKILTNICETRLIIRLNVPCVLI